LAVKIAWLSAETPSVLGGGGERRQFHQIESLLADGFHVEVAALRSGQDDASIGTIVPVSRFGSERGCKDLDLLLQPAGFEAAVVAHVESVPHVVGALRRTGIPWLTDFHNVYSRWHTRRGERRAAWAWRRRERQALRATSKASACSPEERNALLGLGADPQKLIVAGNGVAPGEWPAEALAERRPPVAAFFGSFTHEPNRIGIIWFVAQVWPAVTAKVPEATLFLLGPGAPPASVLGVPGVIHVGRVENLAESLGKVRVVVVPVVEGVGSRVKFGEALASGAAVVSTSEGAEGFDAEGVFARADDPTTFTEATVRLLSDEVGAAQLGDAGRTLALECFSWSQTTAPIVDWLRSVAK
jgi:glycosyltransferase involved in cell wall biosynthesis